MADHTDNALRAAIKALDDVVAPAIDSTNPLAGEQLKLVSRFLGFLRQRLSYQADRDRFELRHYLALAQQLQPFVAACIEPSVETFERAIGTAEAVNARADLSTEDRRAAIDGLTLAISMLVRSSAGLQAEARGQVERLVVNASKALFDVQRAFYLPMGFEPDPELVPDVRASLAAR